MARNTGKPTERQFEDRLTSLGKSAYFYRIKDAASIRGLTGRIGHVDATPSDYIAVVDGCTHFAEVKSTHNETCFPFSLLKAGQNSHGTRIVAAGGSYWIYIHRLQTDEWFVIPFSLIQTLRANGKGSISWTDLQSHKWEPELG